MGLWDPEILARRIAAAPAGRGFLLVLPWPSGRADRHAQQLAEEEVGALVSLLPSAEARALGLDLEALARACEARRVRFAHAALVDFGVPDEAFERAWSRFGPVLGAIVGDGRGVAFHCRGGLGRSGTMAARLLIDLGLDAPDAIGRIRAARPGAIETAAQERYLLAASRSRPAG